MKQKTAYLPEPIAERITRDARERNESENRVLVLALADYYGLRTAVTGETRYRDLEALAARNLPNNAGDISPMIDDGTPAPPSVGSETSSGAPAFGGPFGKSTVDEKVIAQNAGRQTQISRDAENANRAHLERHARGGK